MTKKLSFLSLVFSVSLASTGYAAVIHVPADCVTIQRGIDMAASGDTVLVADGVYSGPGNRDIDFYGKALLLASENGPDSCVIECGGSESDPHRGFVFHNLEDSCSIVRGFTITGGWTDYNGGAILCDASSPTIEDNIITGNAAVGERSNGGGIAGRYFTSRISGNTIMNNISTELGGGMHLTHSMVLIEDNLITGNTSGETHGGGVHTSYSSLSARNNTVTENSGGGILCRWNTSSIISGNVITGNSGGSGSGLYTHGDSAVVVGNTVTGNTGVKGAGIYCRVDSSFRIEANKVTGNTASSQGGGIFCFGPRGVMADNIMSGNSSAGGGGGLYAEGSSLAVTGNRIEDNTSQGNGGGALFVVDESTVEENTITGNTAASGGGVSIGGYGYSVTGNTIRENAAGSNGGGVSADGASSSISENTICENTAGSSGGGVFCAQWSSLLIEGNTIVLNEAGGLNGGGVSCFGGDTGILDNLIAGNGALYGGGGVFCGGATTVISGNTIVLNTTENNGGGVASQGYSGDVILSRNSIISNKSGRGGGCFLGGSSAIVDGVTFSGNRADSGGAIGSRGAFSVIVTVENSILWGDTAATGAEIFTEEASTITVEYSDVMGGWEGEGNIEGDPLFVNGGLKDCRLLWGSPCIDTGHPDSLDADGTRRDMGARSFDQSDHLTLYLTPDSYSALPGGEEGVTYTIINRHEQAEPFWVASRVTDPSGATVIVLNPAYHLIPSNSTARTRIVHEVPIDFPSGRYTYTSAVGLPPATVFDTDLFDGWIIEGADRLPLPRTRIPPIGEAVRAVDAEAAGR